MTSYCSVRSAVDVILSPDYIGPVDDLTRLHHRAGARCLVFCSCALSQHDSTVHAVR